MIADSAGSGYVQFAGDADELHAEAAGPKSVTGPAVHGTDDDRMRAMGWTAPTRWQPNWTSELPLPALTAEFRALAERCTAALRDVHRVEGPDVLRYRAWRDPESQPPGVTWPPERFARLDPGLDPLPLPGLGLPAEPTG